MPLDKSHLDMLLTWSELSLLTGLIFGEARSESWAGKVGVGLTVQTRVKHPGFWNWGRNWREVILCPEQFSCFNQTNPNLKEIKAAYKTQGNVWQECTLIAEHVYLGRVKDFVGAPTHYHRFDCYPSWRKDVKYLTTIEDHKFYTCFQ